MKKLLLLCVAAPLFAVGPGDVWEFDAELTWYLGQDDDVLYMPPGAFDVPLIDRIEFIDDESLIIHYTDGEQRRGAFWEVSIDYAVIDVFSDGRFPVVRLEYVDSDRREKSYKIALSADGSGRVDVDHWINVPGRQLLIIAVYVVHFGEWWPDLAEDAFEFPSSLR